MTIEQTAKKIASTKNTKVAFRFLDLLEKKGLDFLQFPTMVDSLDSNWAWNTLEDWQNS